MRRSNPESKSTDISPPGRTPWSGLCTMWSAVPPPICPPGGPPGRLPGSEQSTGNARPLVCHCSSSPGRRLGREVGLGSVAVRGRPAPAPAPQRLGQHPREVQQLAHPAGAAAARLPGAPEHGQQRVQRGGGGGRAQLPACRSAARHLPTLGLGLRRAVHLAAVQVGLDRVRPVGTVFLWSEESRVRAGFRVQGSGFRVQGST